MKIPNGDFYVCKVKKKLKTATEGNFEFLVKELNKERGYFCLSTIFTPKELIGKKLYLKVEIK